MVSRYNVILVVASVVGVLSLAAVITLIVLWLNILAPFQDYALVIDAGSSHSTIYLYTWPADKSDGLGTTSRINQVTVCNVLGGAVSAIDLTSQDKVKAYFDSAMTECINQIPSTRRSQALIFLGATAGLRLLNITDPSYIVGLLTNIRTYFSTLGLLFGAPENQVRIISGSEEGLSGWISTNILIQELFVNNQPLETYGAIDMGGASTQISFIAPNATSELYTMNLFDTNYDVYSHSYLCYGQDQIRFIYQGELVQQANGATLIDDPCLQPGFNQTMSYGPIISTACAIQRYVAPVGFSSATNVTFRGTGNYTQCQTLMFQRFNKSLCSSTSTCSFDGVYQPVPLSSSLKFIAFSAVYSTFNTLAPIIPLSSDSSGNFALSSTNLTQIRTAIKTVCEQPWSNLSNPDPKYRPFLCFFSMYHWTLFEDGYSMTDENLENLQIVNTINSEQIGWTLGYMINQTNSLDPEYRPSHVLTQAEFIGIIICFIVLLIISIITIIIIIIIHTRRAKSAKKYYQ